MSKIKNYINEYTELIELEFPGVEYEKLFDKVGELILKTGKKFEQMCENDKFDFLVDSILEY